MKWSRDHGASSADRAMVVDVLSRSFVLPLCPTAVTPPPLSLSLSASAITSLAPIFVSYHLCPPPFFPGSKTIMSVTNAKAWSLHPKTQALVAVAGKQIHVTDLLKQTTSIHPYGR